MKVFWHYYRTITLYNILFSVVTAFATGNIFWLPILFCTLGIAAGIFAFNYYFKYQYYFYHNMGYTRLKLITMMFGINICIAIPVFSLLLLLS